MAQGQAKSPVFLLGKIREKVIDPKALTQHQRKICIRHLLEEEPGLSEYQMAALLGVPRSTVNRYKHEILRQDGWVVDQLDVRLYSTNLIRKHSIWISKLEQQQSWYKAASLLKSFTEQLIDLGVLVRVDPSADQRMTIQEFLRKAAPTIAKTQQRYECQKVLASEAKDVSGKDNVVRNPSACA
ncbi:MAG: helix-turn-helix domain-containing protein [Planctomycetes bacterium]|nr:helix-turn-helix domain-containing protein [Planctomycetota bacterium]